MAYRASYARISSGVVIGDTREIDGMTGHYCGVPSVSAYFDIVYGLGVPVRAATERGTLA